MSVPYSFTPNTTIKSAEINTNFQALVDGTGINDDVFKVDTANSGVGNSTEHTTTNTAYQNLASCTIVVTGTKLIMVGIAGYHWATTAAGVSNVDVNTPAGTTKLSTGLSVVNGDGVQTVDFGKLILFSAPAGTYTFYVQHKSTNGSYTSHVAYDSIFAFSLNY